MDFARQSRKNKHMITENKALSADTLETMRLAAVAFLAEEESRNKSNRMIYHISDARYMEMMRFDEALEPKELGHRFKLDVRKRGIE